jgi:hypothetical protein
MMTIPIQRSHNRDLVRLWSGFLHLKTLPRPLIPSSLDRSPCFTSFVPWSGRGSLLCDFSVPRRCWCRKQPLLAQSQVFLSPYLQQAFDFLPFGHNCNIHSFLFHSCIVQVGHRCCAGVVENQCCSCSGQGGGGSSVLLGGRICSIQFWSFATPLTASAPIILLNSSSRKLQNSRAFTVI